MENLGDREWHPRQLIEERTAHPTDDCGGVHRQQISEDLQNLEELSGSHEELSGNLEESTDSLEEWSGNLEELPGSLGELTGNLEDLSGPRDLHKMMSNWTGAA